MYILNIIILPVLPQNANALQTPAWEATYFYTYNDKYNEPISCMRNALKTQALHT